MPLMTSGEMSAPLRTPFGAVGGAVGLSPVLWSVGVFLATGGWLTRAPRR
jgi:hypothetical protein